jgi:hypothetical protein
MENGIKGIENLLVTMIFKTKTLLKNIDMKKKTFPWLFTWELAKQFLVWN